MGHSLRAFFSGVWVFRDAAVTVPVVRETVHLCPVAMSLHSYVLWCLVMLCQNYLFAAAAGKSGEAAEYFHATQSQDLSPTRMVSKFPQSVSHPGTDFDFVLQHLVVAH